MFLTKVHSIFVLLLAIAGCSNKTPPVAQSMNDVESINLKTLRFETSTSSGRGLVEGSGSAQVSPCRRAIPQPRPKGDFSGPNLSISNERIECIKAAVAAGEPMMVASKVELIRKADQFLNGTPKPIRGILKIPRYYTDQREENQLITGQVANDGTQMETLALAYALTNEPTYGAKSKEFLFAWVANLTKPVDGGSGVVDTVIGRQAGDTPIVISDRMPRYLFTFDLLNSKGLLSNDEVVQFRKWLTPFVDYVKGYSPFALNNHFSWKAMFLICAGHVMADRNLFELGLKHLVYAVRHEIESDGSMPEELYRGTSAATYTLMNLEALVQAEFIAEAHGYDNYRYLLADSGGSVQKAFLDLGLFMDDPRAWKARHRAKIGDVPLTVPVVTADWGWIFELGYSLYRYNNQANYLSGAPFGNNAPRAHTMAYSTLRHRPLQ